jgi:hypothetical protein
MQQRTRKAKSLPSTSTAREENEIVIVAFNSFEADALSWVGNVHPKIWKCDHEGRSR